MSIIFFDGFDFYNSFGPGGRKWDAASSASVAPGRFAGQSIMPNGSLNKTLKISGGYSELIVGFAMAVNSYTGPGGDSQPPINPFCIFYDGTTPQCSLWIDPVTQFIKMRTGDGTSISDTDLMVSSFVPPLTLWYYLECQVAIGNPGSVILKINGVTMGSASGQTQQSGNAYTNVIGLRPLSSNQQGTQWNCDDLYIIDPTDATNNVTFLGEVRVQTEYPDAEGYQDDFIPSVGTINADNVNIPVTSYVETGDFNYSGTVGAVDLYSISTFTVAGTIFAVQENLSFRKDDVGNRNVAPMLRTASQNFIGPSFLCYSSYTYCGNMWEVNPNTEVPWLLTDLNLTEFGITVTS